MAPTRPRPALPRPLAVLGLLVLMSGLAAGANLASAEGPAHDHASHSHDDATSYPPGWEPADHAPDAVNGVRASACTATEAQLKKPDLQMALVPADNQGDPMYISSVGPADEGEGEVDQFPVGTKLLRFRSVIMNTGAGPFHVKGTAIPGSSPKQMSTRQKLYTTSTVSTGAANCMLHQTPDVVGKFSGDDHNHWHVEKVQQFQLLSSTGTVLGLGHKTGFCFFDGVKKRRYLPGHPSSPRFPYAGCGYNVSNDTISMGLSVGWGDIYHASISHQSIEDHRPRRRHLPPVPDRRSVRPLSRKQRDQQPGLLRPHDRRDGLGQPDGDDHGTGLGSLQRVTLGRCGRWGATR